MTDSSLSAARMVVDHDVAARIARGHNLLRRPVHDGPGVAALAREIVQWMSVNREVLTKRFAGRTVVDSYAAASQPFVGPSDTMTVADQVELLHRQLRHQVTWLEELRLTVPERDEPAEADARRRSSRSARRTRTPAVVASNASPLAAAVVGAVARASGVLPVVVERSDADDRSLLRIAEHTLPSHSIAVVVVDATDDGHATVESLLALGYAAGALGPDDVIAVLAPTVGAASFTDDFRTVNVEDGDAWRDALARQLEASDAAPGPLVP